jgi:hypothetical protein
VQKTEKSVGCAPPRRAVVSAQLGGSGGIFSNLDMICRVIHNSLRDFQPLRYSSWDGHAKGEHINRGRDAPKFLSYLTGARYVHPCTVTIDSVLANSKTQNAFLFPVHPMFRHDCPLAVKPANAPRGLVHKETWRDSLRSDMLLSAVSVLVVVQPSSEVPEGRVNYSVFVNCNWVATQWQ